MNVDVLTVDNFGQRATLVESYRKTNLDLCRSIIKQSSRIAQADPAERADDNDNETVAMVRELIEDAFEEIRRPEFAEDVARLLTPYFSNPQFLEAYEAIFDERLWTPADDHLPMVDYLLEVHQLGSTGPPVPNAVLQEGETLLDVVGLRKEYLPLDGQGSSLLFFGKRIDFGPSTESYRAATDQVVGTQERRKLEMKRIVLDLAMCVIGHLSGE